MDRNAIAKLLAWSTIIVGQSDCLAAVTAGPEDLSDNA
jgi:hypothetical protein